MGNGCAYWRDVHTAGRTPTLLYNLFFFRAHSPCCATNFFRAHSLLRHNFFSCACTLLCHYEYPAFRIPRCALIFLRTYPAVLTLLCP